MDREQAYALLKAHNREDSHIKHARAVEETMRYFAGQMQGDVDLWGIVGILHDIDWEECMDEVAKHCNLAPDILREAGVGEEIIRAVQSHGYSICTDVEPLSDMEKVLFTIDELTGLVITAALVRPSKSMQDLEVKSIKKKWKDKAFARGVDRGIIQKGAERLGRPLDEVIEWVILALRPVEKELGLGGA
jgi:putative nucleotidyltransferase with HDIG domain